VKTFGRFFLQLAGPVFLFASGFQFETRSFPTLTRSYPPSLYLDHSHCHVLVPATLAALPSTRAIPDRVVFYVARPARSIPRFGFSL